MLQILRYEDIGGVSWNHYIDSLQGSTFNMTAENIEFICEYSDSKIANESFLIEQDNQIAGAAVLCVEKNNSGLHCISWGGHYCTAPYISPKILYKNQEKKIKEIFKYIEELAKKYKVDRICLALDPLANPENHSKMFNYNYLIKYGYTDDSGLTQIVDLRRTAAQLYSDIRKGHKSNIKQGEHFDIRFFDKNSITQNEINIYRHVYEYDAGKVTRNSEMTHHFYQFIKQGKGVLGIAWNQGVPVGVIIAVFYKDTAYYFSYGEKTDCTDNHPPGHILQWKLILYLKEKGIQFYETGEQVYGKSNPGDFDEKAANISLFKRGFGGYTVSHFKGNRINKFTL